MWWMGVGARFARSPRHFEAFGVPDNDVVLCGSSIGLLTNDGSSFSGLIPGRLRERRSDSTTAFRRVKNWINTCRASHSLCRSHAPKPDLPRRVIDVFGYDSNVRLLETSGQKARYAALSHCWGTSYRLTATRESLAQLREGFSPSILAKTFQDAIEITLKLGIRYLWIDCLCIIQDDLADWEVEAAKMASIYRNAHVTISASASTDSADGCFPTRTGDSYVSDATRSLGYDTPRNFSSANMCSLAYPDTITPREFVELHFFEEWLPGSTFHDPQKAYIGSFGKRLDPIAPEPLSARGCSRRASSITRRTRCTSSARPGSSQRTGLGLVTSTLVSRTC
ncbi:hypothetical protein VTI74DRAFT_7951 [Chaetomium olivicolor]